MAGNQDAIGFAERQRAAIAKAMEGLEAAHMSLKALRIDVQCCRTRLDIATRAAARTQGEAEAAYDRLERARAGDLD